MNKRILFITLDLRYGGTNSSLSNLYSAIKDSYLIDVYSLYNKKICNYSFSDVVLPSGKLIYWSYSYLSDLKGFDRVGAFVFKAFIRICNLLEFDLKTLIQKKEVKRILKQNKYDLVIGFQESSATEFAACFKGIKKMAWVHCDYARYYSIVARSERFIYEAFNKIVCVSNYTAQSFISIYPEFQDKVVSIYNLYDKERVIQLSSESIKEDLFDTSVFTILSVGRIDKVKRFSSIPLIAKEIKNRGMSFKWYIIGNIVDAEEYKELKNGITDNDLGGYVVYLGEKRNPYPYFAKSNLFVSTSSSEACPIVFLEAQTFNIPIVSTDFGSAYEFIKDGINGYVSSLNNIHRCIIDVMNGNLFFNSVNTVRNSAIIGQINNVFSSVLEAE